MYPEMGRLVIEPRGSANSTAPKPPSLRCSLFFISGILLAHEAKVKPAIKKKVLTEILKRRFAGKEVKIDGMTENIQIKLFHQIGLRYAV
jgi:hypothetical protein